jgi:hypothetical protein
MTMTIVSKLHDPGPKIQYLLRPSFLYLKKVESFDNEAYMKTKGEDRSDYVRAFINTIIMDLVTTEHETF